MSALLEIEQAVSQLPQNELAVFSPACRLTE
jgi:hypothetical protein